MQASEIIRLLEESSSGAQTKQRIMADASTTEIVRALETCNAEKARQILCDIVGVRHAPAAVPILITCLGDSASGVRSAAADALAKIGDKRAGPALLEHFTILESELPVRRMLALALGAVQCHEATPHLIAALQHTDGSLRGCAAWSLGHLDATEALVPLQEALRHEPMPYAAERIREAVAHLSKLLV
jgi:HEAT repeat protein